MNIRELLLKNHFPSEVTEALLKTSDGFSAVQFCAMYKALMAQKTNINKAYEDSIREEKVEQPVDLTRAILEAKYGKK